MITTNAIRPDYYANSNTYEPINIIEAWNLDFCLGNVIKYVGRAGKKNANTTIEDLQKAAWYINRAIERLNDSTGPLTADKNTVPARNPSITHKEMNLQGLLLKLIEVRDMPETKIVFLPGEITSLQYLLDKVSNTII